MAEEQITYEDLPPDHKKKYDELKAIVEAELIGSFEKTRSHGIRFKGFTPQGVLEGVDLSLPSDERTRALRQEINYVVAHSLHRHSESLVNTLERVALRVVQEIMERRYSPSGPVLGTHQGEMQLHTRPPLPYAMAAPQQQGSPAYVVYKVGGDPGDYQFLHDPPKEIPHGYVCTYVPDCNNWTQAIQAPPGGIAGAGAIVPAGRTTAAAGSLGAEAEKQAWLAKYTTAPVQESSAATTSTADQISAVLRDQFGILPKKKIIGYSKPYPNEFDLIPLPPKYRLPDFNKFSGSEGSSSIEHVSRYLAQLGMVSVSDQLRVRFFSQSLTGPAFGWYTSLQPNSVQSWKQLEELFHTQYHSEATEAGIAELAQVRQKRGETVAEYIQRFRTVKNRCYSVHLTEKEAVELAVAGLAASFKDLTFQVEYNSLTHLVNRLTLYEQRHPELYQDKFKRAITLVNADEDEDSAEDQEVAVAEWTRTPVPVSCKWVNPPGPPRGLDFDVTKTEQIFDLLLKEKQLKLPEGHKIPTAQEMNKRPYCKWHHTFTHATNDCKVLRAQIQMAIESGRLTFGQFAMKVDMRPFPDVNMVDLSHSIREPGFSFDVNMAGFVIRHGVDKAESSHSRGKDKEEAVPRDRPQDDDRRYLTEEENAQRRRRTNEVSVFERLGPLPPHNKRAESSQEEDFEESDGEEDRYHRPRWCPDGLSHSQKRRVQRLRNLEEAEAQYLYTLRRARPDLAVKIQQTLETKARPPKKVWRPKQAKADAQASADADAETSADTNMVFILPSEFRAPSDEEVSVAQFDCGPRPVIFEKPRDRSYRHLKALYLRGYINGQPVSKMLVDTGAAVNIMPYSMLRRLGHSSDDLIKTNITLSDFNGQASEAKGVLNVELTVGRKTIPTAFFIVDSKSNYAVLLGRDWIHANCCIPSTMHQCIIQWDGDEVEVVQADDSIEISLAAMSVWEADDQEPLSGISLEGCERIEASKNGVRLVLSTGLTE
ncbi:hypothetical protein QYE76_042379 [Lolium multiflorum]|uniref:Retrotransposon gag domain-containing protein n=1 Tax=Lolium multiflorum TaxID=4521 RepID=A0AAD8TFH7_LOLMU|nr:hypothetical protein QYE76_042379 [Lolium multiflorum]